ncbi:hypothetical protein MTO96_020877 [Rhipicephalus appendiculatus]
MELLAVKTPSECPGTGQNEEGVGKYGTVRTFRMDGLRPVSKKGGWREGKNKDARGMPTISEVGEGVKGGI